MTPDTLTLIDDLAASTEWSKFETLLRALEEETMDALSVAEPDLRVLCHLQGQVAALKRLQGLPDEAKRVREARMKQAALIAKEKESDDAKRRDFQSNRWNQRTAARSGD